MGCGCGVFLAILMALTWMQLRMAREGCGCENTTRSLFYGAMGSVSGCADHSVSQTCYLACWLSGSKLRTQMWLSCVESAANKRRQN
mmetsp:Transcript_68917/g.111815  ORF Transcript_68917/g.111815 Transcript_68917/m.111815 type:complete len:87 (-) Transcript_68917:193-453(-)